MSEHRSLVHRSLIPIRWGDLDAYGHVNNTVFFRYMEQARVEWLAALSHELRPEGQGPVIINAACTFLAQLNYPGTVTVELYAGPPGRSSIPTYYRLALGDETVAEGESKVVWMDFASGRSVPVPEAIRAMLPATA